MANAAAAAAAARRPRRWTGSRVPPSATTCALPRGRHAPALRSRPKELARVMPDDRAVADEAFPAGRTGPTIVVGLHFGAVEIPALWATARGVPITAPMETVADPDMQSYFERHARRTGLNGSCRSKAPRRRFAPRWRATRRWRSSPIARLSGSGARVELFGAPARLPAGPAVLAVETGAPTWVVATRRAGAEYRTRIERIECRAQRHAQGAPARRSSTAEVARLRARHRRCARAVVDALLPDLGRHHGRPPDGPRRPAHPHARLGRRLERRRDPRLCRRTRPSSTSSRSPITSASTRPRPRGRWRGARNAASRSSSVKRSRRAAATWSALFIDERIAPWGSLKSTVARDPRAGRPGDHRPPAGALSAVRQRPLDPRACSTSRTRSTTPTGSRPSIRRPPACAGAPARRNSRRKSGVAAWAPATLIGPSMSARR